VKRRWFTLRTMSRLLATVVIIAAAAAVSHLLPVQTQIMGPFDVHGAFGETVAGRGIKATVNDVRVAPDVTSVSLGRTGAPIAAAGKWVVVDATIEPVREYVIPKAELVVDGNTYNPSERFLLENLGSGGWMDPGIPAHGAWTFDVAAGLLDDNARTPLVLRVWVGDGRLDSRLVIAIDRHDISQQDIVALNKPRLGG
jgi:hypothetical protein